MSKFLTSLFVPLPKNNGYQTNPYRTYTVPLSKSTNTKFPRWTWASLPSTHLTVVNTPSTDFLTCEFSLELKANLKNNILNHHVRSFLTSSEQRKPVKQCVLIAPCQWIRVWAGHEPVWWDPCTVDVEVVISVWENAESFNSANRALLLHSDWPQRRILNASTMTLTNVPKNCVSRPGRAKAERRGIRSEVLRITVWGMRTMCVNKKKKKS